MSHDQHDPHPNRSTTPEFAPASYGLPTSPSAISTTSPSISTVTGAMRDTRTTSPLQRWAANASDSQFHALAGAIGGFTSGIVTCPLDVIKTKLQAQGGNMPVSVGKHVAHPKIYNGLVGTAKVIWREEGIRGMYRGLGPIVLGYLPTWAVWFTVYNKCKGFLGQYHGTFLNHAYKLTTLTVLVDNPHLVSFWSSIVAGGSSTIVTNPIWVIKTRLMSQSHTRPAKDHYSTMFPKTGSTPTARPTLQSWHYRSTIDAARKMYTSEGITSFYSGLTPALLGLSHVAVQFPTYEFLKTTFTGEGMGEAHANGQPHWVGILSASILSKILASSATYPHEVIRTRLQTQRRPVAGEQVAQGLSVPTSNQDQRPLTPKYRGIVMTFRTILHEEGWRAFYAGLGTNMMRAVPAATVTMLTYEFVMSHLNQAKTDGRAMLYGEETDRL